VLNRNDKFWSEKELTAQNCNKQIMRIKAATGSVSCFLTHSVEQCYEC